MLTRKKVTDFIKLEEGNISKRSALTVGSLLAIVGASAGTVHAWPNCCWVPVDPYEPCNWGPAIKQYCCDDVGAECPLQAHGCYFTGNYICC